jgi:hypothetical protein
MKRYEIRLRYEGETDIEIKNLPVSYSFIVPENISRDDLIAELRERYKPDNMLIAIIYNEIGKENYKYLIPKDLEF